MKFLFILFLAVLISCTQTNNVFNGEFKQINTYAQELELHETPINIEELNCTYMAIVDTFLVMRSELYDEKSLSIYGINNFENYGRFVKEGRGPNECLYLSFVCENQEDSARIWLCDSPDIKVLDVVKSVKSRDAVFGKKMKFLNPKLANVYRWYRVNDSLVFGEETLYAKPRRNIRMIKYNIKQDSIIAQFNMYKNKISDDYSLFFGAFGVNSDGSRIVNSMLFFDQLNFYDFEKQKGFSVSRRKNPIQLTDIPKVQGASIQSYNVRNHYYVRLRVVGDRIFISYCRNKDHETQECSEIHVFNWDGDLLFILKPEQKFKTFEIDEQQQQLYLYRADEKLYRCDIQVAFS